MRGTFSIVVLVALAGWLDWYLNDGFSHEPLLECFQICPFILTRPATRACSLVGTGGGRGEIPVLPTLARAPFLLFEAFASPNQFPGGPSAMLASRF